MRLWVVILASVSALLVTGCEREFGPLPDAQAALKAGCTVIRDQSPNIACSSLEVDLNGDIWTVRTVPPEGISGGRLIAKLSKTDGRIVESYMEL